MSSFEAYAESVRLSPMDGHEYHAGKEAWNAALNDPEVVELVEAAHALLGTDKGRARLWDALKPFADIHCGPGAYKALHPFLKGE